MLGNYNISAHDTFKVVKKSPSTFSVSKPNEPFWDMEFDPNYCQDQERCTHEFASIACSHLLLPSHSKDIYLYLYANERLCTVRNEINFSKVVGNEKRRMMVDKINKICYKLDVSIETKYKSIQLLDRQIETVGLNEDYTAMAYAALFVACKLQEVSCYSFEDYADLLKMGAKTKNIVFKGEMRLVEDLQFQIYAPMVTDFIYRGLFVSKDGETVCIATHYLSEVFIQDDAAVTLLPSLIACSALWLARRVLTNNPPWNDTLRSYLMYSESTVVKHVQTLINAVINYNRQTNSINSVNRKYSQLDTFNLQIKPSLDSHELIKLLSHLN